MSFLDPSLLAIGLPLAALPVAIHLINLRRRRRIEWAAMEFLLESQRRNKRWILLRQLLLMLLRTAAVGFAALMLAGPVLSSSWAGLLGRGATHHVVLLDDSYSMSDRVGEQSVLDEAKRAVLALLEQARLQGGDQYVTLLTFSQARAMAAGDAPPVDRRPLDAATLDEVSRWLGRLAPAEAADGPAEAFRGAARLAEPEPGETRLVYLVSDFRRRQWDQDASLADLARQATAHTARLTLVPCVDQTHANLALTKLVPEAGLRAASVEAWMELEVANYGDEPVRGATVTIEQQGVKLPVVEIDQIAPWDLAKRRFRAPPVAAGAMQMTAQLESDAVPLDNRRHYAAQVPPAYPILIIDGSEKGDDGYFLRTALSPGGRDETGWAPRIEPPSRLRDPRSLDEYAAICLCDVPRLDDDQVAALERYVRDGGGLALFVAARAERPFYNQRLYGGGEGLLPAPLALPTQLLAAAGAAPDVTVSEHPIFRIFGGQRNSFLSVVQVAFYVATADDWRPPAGDAVAVLARLRNQAPLVLEKRYGAGRVLVQLTRLSPQPDALGSWNNLGVNPVFPVYASELVSYLASGRHQRSGALSDAPLRWPADLAQFQPMARLISPRGEKYEVAAVTIDGAATWTVPGAPASGVWQAELTTLDGRSERQVLAVNVPTAEGDLRRAEESLVRQRLRDVEFDWTPSTRLSAAQESLAGVRLGDACLAMLLLALASEQLLAAAASDHAPVGEGRR